MALPDPGRRGDLHGGRGFDHSFAVAPPVGRFGGSAADELPDCHRGSAARDWRVQSQVHHPGSLRARSEGRPGTHARSPRGSGAWGDARYRRTSLALHDAVLTPMSYPEDDYEFVEPLEEAASFGGARRTGRAREELEEPIIHL